MVNTPEIFPLKNIFENQYFETGVRRFMYCCTLVALTLKI
jgi:hypothetical protein